MSFPVFNNIFSANDDFSPRNVSSVAVDDDFERRFDRGCFETEISTSPVVVDSVTASWTCLQHREKDICGSRQCFNGPSSSDLLECSDWVASAHRKRFAGPRSWIPHGLRLCESRGRQSSVSRSEPHVGIWGPFAHGSVRW